MPIAPVLLDPFHNRSKTVSWTRATGGAGPSRAASLMAVVVGIGMLVTFVMFFTQPRFGIGSFIVLWVVAPLSIIGFHLYNALSHRGVHHTQFSFQAEHVPPRGGTDDDTSMSRLACSWVNDRSQPRKRLPPAGIEPATCGLEVRCSIQLSYGGVGNPRGISQRLDTRPRIQVTRNPPANKRQRAT
jgi:hypothetical protein